MFWENIKEAVTSISSNKMRSLLTMLGIIIGISSVIIITTIGGSIQSTLTATMNSLGGNMVQAYVEARYPENDEDWATWEQPEMTDSDYVTQDMIDGLIEKYPDDVKAIAAAGHDLGNHSENHKQMSQLSAEQCKEELLKPHEKVKALTGKEMILFRPPYGDYNDNLIRVCREINYYPIQWDVDSLDWKDYDADTIVRRVTEHKHLGNGSIILCHNGAKHTAEALDTMIKTLKEKGYEFVPISELILKDNYEIDTEGRQHKAG
jgi:hypothetical protein